MTTSETLTLRRLSAGSREDAAALLPVVLGAPHYSLTVSGRLPDPADVEEILKEGPPGKDATDKFVYGIYSGEEMIGCIDLIRGFPKADTAFIGLLLLAESHQGHGLGRQILPMLEQIAVNWRCVKFRIAVIATNSRALHFWLTHGFTETGEHKQIDGYIAEAILLEKTVKAINQLSLA